ncbi:MAG: hypothetical protein JRJ08_04850, partial [Deltaproteobacteria bacterium]|nr:hypothetical protein [Deltaproteobacteria bacterium]
MKLKTTFYFFVFIILTTFACAGKIQPVLEEKPGTSAVIKRPAKSEGTPEQVTPESIPAKKKSRITEPDTFEPSSPPLPSTPVVTAKPPVKEESVPPSPGEKTAAQKEPSSSEKEGVIFNFDNADIHEVVNTVSDILGFNYIVDPGLKGVVNIHTKGKISKKDLFPVLETLLRINNFTIIKKGEFYHIIPISQVSKDYVVPQISLKEEDLPPSDKFIIQVVPLRFVPAKDMASIIKSLMSQNGLAIDKDNLLILLDFSANIKKLLTLIDLFDVDIFDRLHIQVYEVKNADAEELAGELETIFQAFELPADRARAGGITFVSISRINMILAASSNDLLLEKAIQWAREMDTDVSETAIKIHVYYVQNGKAADIAEVLTQVFTGEKKEKKTTFKSKLREKKTTPKGKESSPRKPAPTRSTVEEAVVGEVDIVVDEVNNALVIRATERDYRIVEKTIKK